MDNKSMTNNLEKTTAYDPMKPFLVQKVADMHGVSKSYVYKILSCERENEEIFASYMELLEGTNNLLEAVKKAVPL